jgi:glycine/D-amino acid oxidase-like deaminating enzyme
VDAAAGKFDFTIVGGGILGTAVAALASAAGHGVLVLRLSDEGVPRADTLRNQGWLQSGVMYHIGEFRSEADYAHFATKTFFAGRSMLAECGLPLSSRRGLVCVKRADRIDDLIHKNTLLRFGQDEFRQLESDEVEARLQEFGDPGTTYFSIPDTPFDEAGVLTYLRKSAVRDGAQFLEVANPITLAPRNDLVRIHWDGNMLESPVTLITAGAGSFDLVGQLGQVLQGELRRTPLLVSSNACAMPSPIFIDLDRGFSAVHHLCTGLNHGAIVVGTKARLQPADFALPDDRRIPVREQQRLKDCLHPILAERLLPGRLTAGYEVIPVASKALTAFEPWIEDLGSAIFASPGRATMALEAARTTLAQILKKIRERRGEKFGYDASGHARWNAEISMHYTPQYTFDDAEHVK